jgi:ribosome-binding protein aMBF1 (putative translation factor)
MTKVDPEKLKANLITSEELFTEFVGPPGSPEREKMERDARAWFYGEVLRDRRKELKMTQTELAKETGMKQSYLARLERGQVDIQLSSLLRVTSALGLQLHIAPPDALVYRTQ